MPGTAVTAVGAPGSIGTGITLLEADDQRLVPTSFVAATVKEYEILLVNPVTISGLVAPVADRPPGVESTVYWLMGWPPSEAGAVKVTVACPVPAVAVPIVGAPGIVAGITTLEGFDGKPVPLEFLAVTVNLYATPYVIDTPFVGPVTTIDLWRGEVEVAVMRLGFDVTVYEVIGLPPYGTAGAVKFTVT